MGEVVSGPHVLVPAGSPTRRYEILEQLALGGSATVQLARCHDADGSQRLVVLKRAHAVRNRSDPSGLLAQEAHLASRVNHPNVVQVLDVEHVDDALLLVMQYVEGVTLQELLAGGPVPPRITVRIVQDACEGLGAIHGTSNARGRSLGLVHRNVAPENVLVGVDGLSRLTDFGIAITNASTRMTRQGLRKGKPAYMAPDYITHAVATPSTDLYSLAVVAWEGLTGHPLYAGAETILEVAALQREELPLPSSLRPGLRPGFDAMLLRALGRTKEPRYETAGAFGHALAMACAGDMASRREVGELVARARAARRAAP